MQAQNITSGAVNATLTAEWAVAVDEYQIDVRYHASIHNARPWRVSLLHVKSGAIDDTYGEHAHAIDALKQAQAIQEQDGYTVRCPAYIAERFVLATPVLMEVTA